MLRYAMIPAAMLLLWPAGSASTAEPIRAVLLDLRAADSRVAAVGWRLSAANAARCPQLMAGTGLVIHSLGQYPPGEARAAALALQPGLAELSVLAVVPGSPAAVAGLAAGDAILAINGQRLAALPLRGTHPSAQRDAAEQELGALPVDAPVVLTLRRGTEVSEVTIAPRPACRTRIEVVAGNAIKARSNSEIIQIGQNFAAGLDDDGLATVIAHELAHIVLDHYRRLSAVDSGTTRKAMARQFEDEADLLSLDLLADAGWDPAIAPRFLRRHAGHLDPHFSGGAHRKARDRAARMERELDERLRSDG